MTALDLDAVPLEALIEHLASDDPNLRADAVCAIGDRVRAREIPNVGESVREKMAALLDDDSPIVRFEAAIALAEVHDRRAVQTLLQSLGRRDLRLDATRALGTLGDSSAIPALRDVMARWLMPWADRLQAAAALCALHDAEGSAYLREKCTSRKRAERAAAIHFLGESRHPEALALLPAILRDRNDPLRDVAARALGLLGNAQARTFLEEARTGADSELASDIDQALALLR